MKMKKVFAVLASSVIAAGSLASLAACGGEAKANWVTLDIANYARELPQKSTQSAPVVTTAKKLPVTYSEFNRAVNNVTVRAVTSGSGSSQTTEYKIYDLVKESDWGSASYELKPTLKSVGSFVYAVAKYEPATGGDAQYSVTSAIGELFPKATYDGSTYYGMNISTDTSYGNVDGKSACIYTLTAAKSTEDSGYETVKAYVLRTTDEFGEYTYTKGDSADFADYNTGNKTESAAAGDKLELYKKTAVYKSTAKKPVNDDTKNYTYTYDGVEYTFYNGDEKKGSVKAEGAVAFVGNYMYYNEYTYLPDTAVSGFNWFTDSVKQNVALFKYDFVNNSVTEIKTEYVIDAENITAAYNYKDGAYDAATCYAFETKNGFVYSGDGNARKILITDANLNPAYDITRYGAANLSYFTKIKDGLFLLTGDGSYSVDKDLKPIYSSGSAAVILGNEICTTFTENDKTGIVSLDGTVKIAAKYVFSGTPNFIGGYAYCSTYENGARVDGFLKEDGTFTKLSSRIDATDNFQNLGNGVYQVRKYTDSSLTAYAYYNYGGTKIKEFKIAQSSSDVNAYSSVEYSNGYVIATPVNGSTEVYKLKSSSNN